MADKKLTKKVIVSGKADIPEQCVDIADIEPDVTKDEPRDSKPPMDSQQSQGIAKTAAKAAFDQNPAVPQTVAKSDQIDTRNPDVAACQSSKGRTTRGSKTTGGADANELTQQLEAIRRVNLSISADLDNEKTRTAELMQDKQIAEKGRHDAEKNFNTSQSRVTMLQQDLIAEQKHNKDLTSLLGSEKSRFQHMVAQHRDADRLCQKIKSEAENLLSLNKSQEIRIKEILEENQELNARIQSQESTVTRAQVAAVDLLSKTVSTALPDDAVRRRFDDMFDNLQNWARENANGDTAIFRRGGIIKPLIQDKVLNDNNKWPTDLIFDFDDATAVDTLLNAALAHDICSRFFSSPFWFMRRAYPMKSVIEVFGGKNFTSDVGTDEVFDAILEMIMTGDAAGAHAWRAKTVETFSQGKQCATETTAFYGRVVDKFCRRYPDLLRSDLPEDERRQLIDIVAGFGKFSLQLWAQKSTVDWYGSSSFADLPFLVASGDMVAAQAVKLLENDTALDNRPIPVVVQPLIVAFGNPEGKDYQKRKVWSKAVVWISSKNRKAPQILKRRMSTKVTVSKGSSYIPSFFKS